MELIYLISDILSINDKMPKKMLASAPKHPEGYIQLLPIEQLIGGSSQAYSEEITDLRHNMKC
jgi:hypothetical protein